jgi:hypothetical protein
MSKPSHALTPRFAHEAPRRNEQIDWLIDLLAITKRYVGQFFTSEQIVWIGQPATRFDYNHDHQDGLVGIVNSGI